MPVKKVTSDKKQATSKKAVTVPSRAKQSKLPQIGEIAVPKIARSDKKATVHLSLTVPVYSLAGNESGTLTLPKEVFAVKVSKQLLSQAVRVYATNQKTLPGSTKTRGEVEGSTAKIYRQKGTGRARHGAIRAPIFVGGGIALGPKPRKLRLVLPQKMKKAALFGALSSKLLERSVLGVTGIEKTSGKTKEIANFIDKLLTISSSPFAVKSQKSATESFLIVTDKKVDNVVRAVRNIPGLTVLPAPQLNAYEVLRHQFLVLSKEAVGVIAGTEKTPETDKINSDHKTSVPAQAGSRSSRLRVAAKKGKEK